MDYQVACPHCRAHIGIMAVQVGQRMRCPHCHEGFNVADPQERDPSVPLGQVFSFRCTQCHSRLEAYTGMIGQSGQCPTCAVECIVRRLNEDAARAGGTEPEAEYRQPVHAYAAAGEQAPEILRLDNGAQAIRCPRCKTINEVNRNNCTHCSAPFTLEGAERAVPVGKGGSTDTAAMVLGVVGVVLFFIVVPSLLALVFGVIALMGKNANVKGGRGMAIAGTTLGAIGLLLAVLFYAMWV